MIVACGSGGSSPAPPTTPPAISVSISPASATINVGATQQFSASVLNTSNTAVNWLVDSVAGGNTMAGTISAAGLYTAPSSPGSHTIAAVSQADATKSASATVTVAVPPAISVSVTPASATVGEGNQQQFVASVVNSTNVDVNWLVDTIQGGNSSVGTINTAGLYTAPFAPGTHTITAVSQADTTKSASATLTVTRTIVVLVSPTAATVQAGAKQQFGATVTGTPNFGVTWSVDSIVGGSSTVGTVTSNGLYVAPATSGQHTVSAISIVDTGSIGSAQVTVPPGISISPASPRIGTSTTQQFTITATDPTLMNVTWAVDGVAGGNGTTGTISGGGLYTAPAAAGTHTIVASSVASPGTTASTTIVVLFLAPGTAAVLTHHNDLARTGQNLLETALTPATVNSTGFGKLFSYPVDGQMYAQPLYVPNLTINGASHNVVFAATENNSVYAFDADGISSTPLWQVNLGAAAASSDTEGISPLLGITATPVIDNTSGTMYLVTDLSNRTFHLHALDITSGKEKNGAPIQISASVAGTGGESQNGIVTLSGGCYQRGGLALVDGIIYISFGHCLHGWVLGYDASSLAQVAVFNSTPNGQGGAVWMGGGAPAADSNGNLYVMTGVDANSFGPGYNDSFVRLGKDANGAFGVLDYFTPSDNAFLLTNDADLGSGSPIVLPDNTSATPHELVGGGKDGRIFIVNRDNMGGFSVTGNAVVQIDQRGNTQFDVFFDTPAFWNGTIYYHGEQDVLEAYQYSNGMISPATPTSRGNITFGQHGATPSISANGSSGGIVWEIQSDQWRTGGAAILHAYDATNVAKELYNSSQSGTRDVAGPAVKFTVPTIADGHVFVGSANELDVYGLLPQ
jgi:hypothetical protein